MKSIRLLVVAREEARDAALYYENCSNGLGKDFTDILAVMHTSRNPAIWKGRVE